MNDKTPIGLAAILSFGVVAAWLNITQLLDALIRAQPGLPPYLTLEGLRLVKTGSLPALAPVWGLLLSGGIAAALALRNIVVSDRPWLRMGMFIGLLSVFWVGWTILQMKFSFMNPANLSDPEISGVIREGILSIRVFFVRGGASVTAGFGYFLAAYTALVVLLAYPESQGNSSEHGVQSSLRR